MDYTILGRTRIPVSVIGVGSGGPSRMGMRTGRSRKESVALMHLAAENGVNFIDTAEAYGTEELVGAFLREVQRESMVVSTKISYWEELDAEGYEAAVTERLRILGVDYLDVCHFHAVEPDRYEELVSRLLPVAERLKERGVIRAVGITERFIPDPGHAMLERAVSDPYWDVVMVGYNLLNQSARELVLPATRRAGIGVLAMFAVRLALSRADRLQETVRDLIASGQLTEADLAAAGGSLEDPLGWVVEESDADSLPEAAYRFVRHTDGVHVTLTGTGDREHLLANIRAAQLPPLPPQVVAKLRTLFGRVRTVSGQ